MARQDQILPDIKALRIEVTESGYGVEPGSATQIHDGRIIPDYIPCRNQNCFEGGLPLGEILLEMMRQKKTDLETSRLCQGYEGSPKGRTRYRSCANYFKIRIHIDYKPRLP